MTYQQHFFYMQQNEVYSQIKTSKLNFIGFRDQKALREQKANKKCGKESTENTTS